MHNIFRSPRIHWGWATLQSAIWRVATLLLRKYDSKFCNYLSAVLLQVGGMRVVTRPRVSESEKPVEKTKEEGEEARCSFSPFIAMGGWIEIRISCISPGTHCMILYIAQIIRGVSGFPVFLPSIQNKFQILPVEDNWEKGVRQEFRPFSSEISSQVSRSALLDLIPSFFVLGLPSLPPLYERRCWKISLNE